MSATEQVRDSLCTQAHAAMLLHAKLSNLIMELPEELLPETCDKTQELCDILDNSLGAAMVASDLIKKAMP